MVSYTWMSGKSGAARWTLCAMLGLLLGSGGCTNPPSPAPDQQAEVDLTNVNPGVPEPAQKLFASPLEAAAALKEAVMAKDRRLLIEIFGPQGKQLVLSGDRVQENNDLVVRNS